MTSARSLRAWWGCGGLLVACTVMALVDGCGDDTIVGTGDAGVDATVADSSTADAGAAEAATDAATTDAPVSCLVDAGPFSDAEIQQGLALVKQYKCQSCHGQLLSGNNNGVANGFGGVAYPPNLTPDEATGLGCWSEDIIVRAILDGVDDQLAVLCPPMPRFADAGLDEAGAHAIASFLKSYAPQSNMVPDTDCSYLNDAGVDAGVDASDGSADANDGSM